jgi:mediator of RNA polymerase II transcription subunit 5
MILNELDLIEPFLAPALIAVFEWMLNDAFRRKSDLKFTAQLLSKVFAASADKPGPYQTAVMIMGFTIDRFLRKIISMSSKLPEWLEGAKRNTAPYVDFRRTLYSPFKELKSLRDSSGSLKIAFRSSIQSLINWSVSASVVPIQEPANYTPQTFYVSLLILGPRCILQILLDEIKTRTADADGSAPLALDLAAALVCSPVPGSALAPAEWMHTSPSVRNARASLREELRQRALAAPKLWEKDQMLAASVVRLHRRVETLLQMTLTNSMAGLPDAAAAAAAAGLMPQLVPEMDEGTAAAVDLAAAAVGVGVDGMDFGIGGADHLMVDPGMALDLSGGVDGAGGMDVLGSGVGDDDIFGDLLSADMTDIELNY